MDKKQIICSGCSYTWGQGLWSYLETDKFVPGFWDYVKDKVEIPIEGEQLREELRWPRLVAEHFNLNEIVKPFNGGTDEESINFIEYLLNEDLSEKFDSHFGNIKTFPINCKWIIFQTTQLYRSSFYFEYKNDIYKLRSTPSLKNLSILEKKIKGDDLYYPYEEIHSFEPFYNWLIDNNLSLDDFEELHKNSMVSQIESVLKKYNDMGINIGIMSWTDEYLDLFKTNKFISNNFIKFEYNGITYDCIEDMQIKNDHLYIEYDTTKLHNADGDMHPSKECHEVIANAVIRYMENYE